MYAVGRSRDESWSLQKHPRNGRLLSVWFTVSCDRRIFVRACLHFVSFDAASRLVLFPPSVSLSLPFLSLTHSIFSSRYDPAVFSYFFNPFFFVRGAQPSHALSLHSYARLRRGEGTRVRAWRWALRRFNERYYDLVALDIAHINPRGTLILALRVSNSLEWHRRAEGVGKAPENLLIAQQKKSESRAGKKNDRTRPEVMSADRSRDAKN